MFKIENDLLWIGSILLILFFLWMFTGGPSRIQNGPFIKPLAPVGTGQSYGNLAEPKNNLMNTLSSSSTGSSNQVSYIAENTNRRQIFNNTIKTDIRNSIYKDLVFLETGNAAYEKNPNFEYITLSGSNNIKESINVSGWTLKNGADNRKYDVNGQVFQGKASTVKIPQAVLVWEKNKNSTVVPVKISAGQKVQVVSGYFPPIGDYQIRQSFRVNKCMGYIANQKDYVNVFSPGLYVNCPRPDQEVGVESLDDKCYDTIRSIGSCREVDLKEDWCNTNISSANYDNICRLTTNCKSFIKSRFNYQSCVGLHRNDSDFLQSEWRVFIGSAWEIWSDRRETITLYDQYGKIVDQVSYGDY